MLPWKPTVKDELLLCHGRYNENMVKLLLFSYWCLRLSACFGLSSFLFLFDAVFDAKFRLKFEIEMGIRKKKKKRREEVKIRTGNDLINSNSYSNLPRTT